MTETIGFIGLIVTGISLVVATIALWHAIIQSKVAKEANEKIIMLQYETIKRIEDSELTEKEKSKLIRSIAIQPIFFKSVAGTEAPTILGEYKPEKPNSKD